MWENRVSKWELEKGTFSRWNTANSVLLKMAQNETVCLLPFDVGTTSGRDPEIITVNSMFCNGTESCE